ncbi:uncharacterized protein ALTATR162_LOCUS9150 [Alternaria atra]|uniref:Uncharacterized protein n=1 Tax=Alternaria atra TaxID=119953 RepID=A0A8J2N9I7_9PLEO|nr:uncharacterized protein ALTATR162_LOCUS9150 [Alternaria atra]CAG5179325.1 unnamed protein product [Alternaria atra]
MAGNKDVSFSAREMEVLALAWQCMDQQPKINMEKLASLTGYTIGSAGVTFGKIKTKIKLLGESLNANGPSTPKRAGSSGRSKTASTPSSTPRKRAATTASTTPVKRPRKGGRQLTSSPSEDVSAANDDDDDNDEEFGGLGDTKVKVKKEEPGFDQASGFYDEALEQREMFGDGATYGLLDGVETFGGVVGGDIGSGRNASTGYRKLFAKDAE